MKRIRENGATPIFIQEVIFTLKNREFSPDISLEVLYKLTKFRKKKKENRDISVTEIFLCKLSTTKFYSIFFSFDHVVHVCA